MPTKKLKSAGHHLYLDNSTALDYASQGFFGYFTV